MEIKVNEDPLKFNYTYQMVVDGNESYFCRANRPLLLMLKKMSIYDNQQELLGELEEESKLQKLINMIPLVGLFAFKRRFIIKVKGKVCGQALIKSAFVQVKAAILFNDEEYTICGHTNDGIERYSIFHYDRQIGLVTKSPYSEWGNDSYESEFDYDSNKLLNLLLISLIDGVWNTSSAIPLGFSYESKSYRRGLDIRFGVKLDKDWKPKQNYKVL